MTRTYATPDQIATWAQGAGWTGDDLVTAVAVCLAESGGWIEAIDPADGTTYPNGTRDYGLWQINALPAAAASLYIPTTNATRAHILWLARGWQPWVAYNNGKHLPFMETAAAAVDALAYPVIHLALLKPGLRNNDVLTYQRALRVGIGPTVAGMLNPSGATGFYGNETKAMTAYAYRNLLHLYGGDLTVPGPSLLRWLHLRPIA